MDVGGSSAWRKTASARSAMGDPGRATANFARRSRSGGARRSPISQPNRSLKRRSPGWRSCGPRLLRIGSRRIWRSASHTRVVSELEAAVAVRPLRERPYRQLMVALVPVRAAGRRAGRLPDGAADAGGRDRHRTGRPLQRLQRAILQQDPRSSWPAGKQLLPVLTAKSETTRTWLTGSVHGRRLLAIGGALTLALALVLAAATHGSAHLTAGPDTVGVIDGATAGLGAVVTGVGRPNGIAYGAGAIWITDSADNLLLRVDPAGQVIDRIPVGHGPAGVTFGDGEVWVANELDGTVSEVNPGAGRKWRPSGSGSARTPSRSVTGQSGSPT